MSTSTGVQPPAAGTSPRLLPRSVPQFLCAGGGDSPALVSVAPRRHVREDVLLEAFEQLEGVRDSVPPSRELYDLLLDLLFAELAQRAQESMGDLAGVAASPRVDLFRVFAKLLVHHVHMDAQADAARAALERVHATLRAQPLLLALAAERDWLSALLVRAKHLVRAAEPLRTALWALVHTLAQDHCSSRHVRRLFRALAVSDASLRAHLWPPVLALLRALWSDASAREYFELEGNASALLVPDTALARWPSSGYSVVLSVWLHAASTPHARPAVAYTPYLFSFLHDRSQVGIEALLVPAPAPAPQGVFVLAVRALGKGDTGRLQIVEGALIHPQQWAHLALAHRPGTLLGRAQLSVALNGKHIGTVAVPYPKPSGGAMNVGRIACSAAVPENAAHSLRGRLGAVTLMDEALADAALVACSRPDIPASASAPSMARVVFRYEARAVAGSLCVDVAHGDKARHATLLGTVAARRTHALRDSLLNAHTLRTLLPLFAPEFRPRGGEQSALLVQLLELVHHMAESAPRVMDALARADVFALLGHVLSGGGHALRGGNAGRLAERGAAWSARAVTALDKLLDACKGREDLWRALLQGVVMNQDVWRSCSFDVQHQTLVLLASRAAADAPRVKRAVSVAQLLHLLTHYDEAPHSRAQLRELRFLLLSTARALMSSGQGVLRGEVAALLGHALHTRRHAVDVLQLLLTLLQQGVAGVREHLHALDAPSTLCALLLPHVEDDEGERDRRAVWALKLLGQLHHAHVATLNAESERDEAVRALLAMQGALEASALSVPVYHALLEVACNAVALAGVTNPLEKSPPPRLVVPQLFGLALSLACTSDSELLVRVLSDLVTLLTASATARDAVLSVGHWHQWLLPLIASGEPRIASLVHASVAQLVAHAVQGVSGERVVVQLRAAWCLLEGAHAQWASQSSAHLRAVLVLVTQTLALGTPAGQARLLEAARNEVRVWLSLCALVEWVDAYLFVLPADFTIESALSLSPWPLTPLMLHRDSNGLWVDLTLARHFLEFSGALLLLPMTVAPQAPSVVVTSTPAVTQQGTQSQQQQLQRQREKALRRVQHVYTRLTLYTLEEAQRYQLHVQTEARSNKAVHLAELLRAHVDVAPTAHTKAVQRYLQSRTRQWSVESADVDAVLRRSLSALQASIAALAADQSEDAAEQSVFILLYLHHALKRSATASHAALPATLRSLFSAAANAFRTHLSHTLEHKRLVDSFTDANSFLAFLYSGLDNLASFVLRPLAQRGVERVLTQEKRQCRKRMATITSDAADLAAMLDQRALHDAQRLSLAEQRITENATALLKRTEAAKARFNIDMRTRSVQLERDWRRALRELTAPRGPWSSISRSEMPMLWRLEQVETRNRRRLKLVPCSGASARTLLQLKPRAESDAADSSSDQVDLQALLHSPLVKFPSAPPTKEVPLVDELLIEVLPAAQLPPSSKEKDEKPHLTYPCRWVKPAHVLVGELEVSGHHVVFRHLESSDVGNARICKILTESITRAYRRRAALQPCAIELFTTDKRAYFFAFEKPEALNEVLKFLIRLRLPNFEMVYSEPPDRLFKKLAHITESWRRREMSNFDYLMELNTIAGRTYNDLSQYPVMPWVLADYTSDRIDLTDERIYRDLSKPIGALNPDRLKTFQQRYESLLDSDELPPFYYGSHYSSAGIVLYYLVRLEPFTNAALKLQDGKFDHAQRMFWSIPETWNGCLTNPSDVKELIPEFFYCPAMFTNINQLPLGSLKRGDSSTDISQVILPPWAKNDPDLFVSINREALESEVVSSHLHEWIDLIFGMKQRGEAAVTAHNVFFHLTYEGAIDFESIDDPVVLSSVKSQIESFGQTPSQLLKTPHPRRMTLAEVQKEATSLSSAISGVVTSILNSPSQSSISASLANTGSTLKERARGLKASISKKVGGHSKERLEYDETVIPSIKVRNDAVPVISFLQHKSNQFVILYEDYIMHSVSYKSSSESKLPLEFSSTLLSSTAIPMVLNKINPRRISSAVDSIPSSSCLLIGGDFDCSITLVSFDLMSTRRLKLHNDVVTCVRVSEDQQYLVTSAADSTTCLWSTSSFSSLLNFGSGLKRTMASIFQSDVEELELTPIGYFYGQEGSVISVDVHSDSDVVVTGSSAGTCCVFSLSSRRILRTIESGDEMQAMLPVMLRVSSLGYLVSYWESVHFNELQLHSLQHGRLLGRAVPRSVLLAMAISDDGSLLATGGENGCVSVYTVVLPGYLHLRGEWKCGAVVRSLSFLPGCFVLLVGLHSGEIAVIYL